MLSLPRKVLQYGQRNFLPARTRTSLYHHQNRSQLIRSRIRRSLSTNTQSVRASYPQMSPRLSAKNTSAPRKPAAYESLVEKLALRSSPVLLYQASSYTPYIVGCYMVGGFFIAIAAFNYRTQDFARPGDLPKYVPVFITVGSSMIACFGLWQCLKVRNIMKNSLMRLTNMTLATEFGPSY